MLPLAIELISGLMYGLMAFMLSHVGSEVDPGDITLLNCLPSPSGSGLMPSSPGVELPRPLLLSAPGVDPPGATVFEPPLPPAPAGLIALQFACESMTTSSVSIPFGVLEELRVLRMAHMY